MTDHEALVGGLNLLETGGWQKDVGAGDGPHCAVSALKTASGWDEQKAMAHIPDDADCALYDFEPAPGVRALAGALEIHGDELGPRIGQWNDAPERTYEEVREAYHVAISATAPLPNVDRIMGERIAREAVTA